MTINYNFCVTWSAGDSEVVFGATSAMGGVLVAEEDDEVPQEFLDALKDIEEGNFVDFDDAISGEPPPEA